MNDHLDELRAIRIEKKQAEIAFIQAARGLAMERMVGQVYEKTLEYFDAMFLQLRKLEKQEAQR